MTTKPNPLGIDYTAILNAATLRTQNLQALGDLIGNNIVSILEKAHDVKTFMEMLDSWWDLIDPEGRGLAPKEVARVMSYMRTQLSNMDTLLTNHDVGLRHLEQFGTKPGVRADVTPYTIKIAMETDLSPEDMANAIGELYGDSGPAGEFNVDGKNHDWVWVTFTRDLRRDGPFIHSRMGQSNFTRDAQGCAADQLIWEFETENPDSELAQQVCKALLQAEVRFPQP